MNCNGWTGPEVRLTSGRFCHDLYSCLRSSVRSVIEDSETRSSCCVRYNTFSDIEPTSSDTGW